MTDEQFIELAHGGDTAARDQLLKKYKKQVLSIARRFFLTGGETEDLVQEGMCGLYSAIENYHEGENSSFSTYAYACIRNRITDVVKASRSQKNTPLNEALPIYEVSEGALFAETNPEDEVIRSEDRREFLQKIGKVLSSFEFQVMVMYIDGLSLSEIANSLDKSVKSVDNAISRAKKKLVDLFADDSKKG